MPHTLSIQNYALIEDIQMDLKEGFTVITGETGAGKSIMLGALSLLLGKRADFSAIRDSGKKCVIEGNFNVKHYHLETLFSEQELDYEEHTIIRREILPSGKSRAFVNDTPANLAALQVLGQRLLDIHSQHDTLNLGDTDYQFLVLDALASNGNRLKTYRQSLSTLKDLECKLETLRSDQQEAAREYDYNRFLLEELQQARLEIGMQEELENRFEELNNVEQLTENLGAAVQYLQQEEIGAAAGLKEARNNVQRVSGISTAYHQLFQRLQSVSIELDDIAVELETALEKVEANPQELSEINQQLQVLYGLQKKHSVATVEELLEVQNVLEQKVAVSETVEGEIAAVEESILKQKNQLEQQGEALHTARKAVIPKFITEIERVLSKLGMQQATFRIELERQPEFFHTGQDRLMWLLAANKGGQYNDIKKAASGGELSRIMLAVKSILATYSKLPTIIFDEIDTGISGDIAQKMAAILKRMGQEMQVISITHLPQIAAQGDRHFKIFKENTSSSTSTNILELRGDSRVQELAMMLGGKNITDSAVAHAKALLN